MSQPDGPDKGWKLTVRIVGATFAVMAFPIGFPVFALLFHNYSAGIVTFFVGMAGAFNLHLHMSFKHDRIHENYSEWALTAIRWGSACLGGLGLAGAVTFFGLAAAWKTGIHPIETSMVLPGIQCLVVFQECAVHYYFRRKYLALASEPDRSQLATAEETEDAPQA